MKKRFVSKRSHFKKYFFFYMFFLFLFLGIAYSNLIVNLGIGGTISLAKYQVRATITLDSTGATTPGTTEIYEVGSLGFFLDSSYQNEITTLTNPITVPTKTNYQFMGYFTKPYGRGVEYINSAGFITADANNNHFSSDGTLYAYFAKTLYSVLEDAAEEGTYAMKYTGAHQDSYAGTGTQDIYHWYADNDTNGTAILDKNNVIFAGQCWQMLRSTDTGGVKLIYNGEPENNQCLNTRENHIGYYGRKTSYLAGNYYYGTDYNYDSTNGVFSLSGTITQATWNATTGPILVGKYTCGQTTESGTCATLYLVESYYNTSSGYVIPINNNSHYSQFGTLQYNPSADSPSYVGYMYNAEYQSQKKGMIYYEFPNSNPAISTSYWYANNVVWGSPTADNYNLVNPYQISSSADYSSLVGKYTFMKTSKTFTATSVYYIVDVNSSYMRLITLSDKGNHTLADFNYTYTYGDSYIDNGNGTFTINNPTTTQRINWHNNYSNINKKYLCKNTSNNTCSELWYSTFTNASNLDYVKVADNYKYSKGFTWNGSKYILDNNTSVTFFDITDNTNMTNLNNAHYTCWNATGECTSVSFIHFFDTSGDYLYYINLTNGESIEDAKNKMFYVNDVNTKNSTIKTGIDAWYAKYLSNYDSYIEDTIFCNDRKIDSLGGWNLNGDLSNGGWLLGDSSLLRFKEYNVTSDLSCPIVTDQFSTLNPKAKLTHKVGLISSSEMNLLNNNIVRVTGKDYWLASPYSFQTVNNIVASRYLNYNGEFGYKSVATSGGVRPAISLKPGTIYTIGDGSMETPYIIDDGINSFYLITIDNNEFSAPNMQLFGSTITIFSNDYIVTSFKLNGTLVNGDTFTMPSEDVSITDIQYIQANYTITNMDQDIFLPATGRYGSTITLTKENYKVLSFKLNGTLVNGNSFIMPSENVTITEIVKIPQVTIESEHNPYANNINNVVYYENTFTGATSLTIELTYQTESTSWDWIYLYDNANSSTPYQNKKYGGTTMQTETITLNSNYIKIVFRTDNIGNNYYGFKAVITANYS